MTTKKNRPAANGTATTKKYHRTQTSRFDALEKAADYYLNHSGSLGEWVHCMTEFYREEPALWQIEDIVRRRCAIEAGQVAE